MKLNITKQFGQFLVTITTELPGVEDASPLHKAVLEAGFLHEVERGPSTTVEQKVFGPLLGWEKNKKGNYQKPKGFARNSVDYTEDLADNVAAAYEGQTADFGAGLTLPITVTGVTRYVVEDGNSRKMATAFVDTFHREDTVSVLLGILGLDEEASYDDQVEAAHKKFYSKK